MGRVRTKTVKKAARLIVEKYYTKLTTDFPTNKRICAEVAVISSQKLRNKISGFVTHLMKRIEKGPVRGISLKLQEEERERRENIIPDHSIMDDKIDEIVIDPDTQQLLVAMGFDKLAGVSVVSTTTPHFGFGHHMSRHIRERRHRDHGEMELPGGKNRKERVGPPVVAVAVPPYLPVETVVV